MWITRYRCRQCGRTLKRRECILHDDPMAPLDPELLCPQCEELVVTRHNPWIIVPFAVVIIGLSVWIGLYVL